MLMTYIIILLFGLLFGSFLNVCIHRIPRVHLMLTEQSFQKLRTLAAHSRPQPKGIRKVIPRYTSSFLQFLGLHPGPLATTIPSEVLTKLAPLKDQDYVTLNDFAAALEAQLDQDQFERYGDLIFHHAIARQESIVLPASHCPACQTPINPWDNIPVLSFLFLQGNCRACGAKISWRYPLIELLTAFLFLACMHQYGLVPQTFLYWAFISALIVLSFIDLDHRLIPDAISVPGVIVGLLVSPLLPIQWYESLLGILLGAGIIKMTGEIGKLVFKKEAMGGGDVKLMAMIGAFLGWKMIFLTLFLGSMTGAIIGIVWKLFTGKEYIPFGPFLSIGALFSLFFGAQVLHWYGIRILSP